MISERRGNQFDEHKTSGSECGESVWRNELMKKRRRWLHLVDGCFGLRRETLEEIPSIPVLALFAFLLLPTLALG